MARGFPHPWQESKHHCPCISINNYLPIHMCPHFTLSDNGTELKNQLMDNVLQQLGIDHIFSGPCHPQSNGKLEVFNKYLKPTLKKVCEKDLDQMGQIHQPSISQLPCDITACNHSFFLVCGRDPILPLHQLLEPMQQIP